MNNSNKKSVKVAAIQMQCDFDPAENKRRTVAEVRRAVGQGAEIICLQELFASRYFCQTENHEAFDLAEPIPGPTTEEFSRLAAELGVVIVVSLFERRAPGIFHNTAVILDADGSTAGVYRKMHIPDDPCYYEKFYFTPGDLGFRSFQTAKARIGVCICWDQWFPEAARLTALTGAEILVYPTAIGWLLDEKQQFGSGQLRNWQTMMVSHAIANGVFVVAPNRTGIEDQIEFWGNSFVVDPYGNKLVNGDDHSDGSILTDCDLSLIETARTHWPFLRDRRVDAYGNLLKRFVDE